MKLTPEQIEYLRRDAEFTSIKVGAPGSPIRQHAQWMLALIEDYIRLSNAEKERTVVQCPIT